MKSRFYLLLLALPFVFTSQMVWGQCAHDPSVQGDSLLCPNEGGMLTTQTYDSYQWYKRAYGSGTTSLIPGETSQTISLTSNDVLYYFSVDATQNGCTERSPELLVDGYVFLLPYVASSGDFTIGGNGESIICTGDTMYLTMGLPYDTMITWYKNGNVIVGADSTTLVVTTAGSYTCEGAPSVCPTFIQPLGLNVEVVETNCGVGTNPSSNSAIHIGPNPIQDRLMVRSDVLESIEVRVTNAFGQLVAMGQGNGAVDLELAKVPAGVYWVAVLTADGIRTQAVTKQ